jgi:DNA repair protein RecN (Recombination protein N)
MLSRLHIENFALIDTLDIEFGDGLNVLTGSTGAGKSIIVGALDLILGGRGSEEVIRTGESASIVEASFKLDSQEPSRILKENYDIVIDDDRNIIFRREYKRKGGGRAFIESSQVSIAALKDISEHLADILGQHSHQALLNPATHCTYLDRYAGIEAEVTELKTLYNKTIELRESLLSSDRIAREISDRIDLLTYQVSEIDKAGLKISEEESLKEEKKLLENSQKIHETAEWIIRLLLEDEGSAIEKIGQAEKGLGTIASSSEAIIAIIDALRGASDTVRETVLDLKNLTERIDDNPMRLEEVNERLDEIFRLKKKYGTSIAEVIKYSENAGAELSLLKTREHDTRSLKERFEKSLFELNMLAEKVSLFRKKARPSLEKLVVEKLALMGIPKAQFAIEITKTESDTGLYVGNGKPFSGDALGFDIVEFQFCANPGEGLKPLARIASGGEISRVMLALKNAFLRKKGGTCEVFDEIDVGISGDVAAKVARQLYELSKKHQVICITHLAQIASMADYHFRVYKSSQKGRSVTRVIPLNYDDRVREIASLISGEKISPKSLAGAEELLKFARNDQ